MIVQVRGRRLPTITRLHECDGVELRAAGNEGQCIALAFENALEARRWIEGALLAAADNGLLELSLVPDGAEPPIASRRAS